MKSKSKEIRKLTKTSRTSMYVILPKEFIDSLGWKEHQKLVITRGKGCVTIRDWRARS